MRRTLSTSLGNDISKVNRIVDILLIKSQLGFLLLFLIFCNIECSLSKEMNRVAYIYLCTAHRILEFRKKGFISITSSLIYGFCTVHGQGVHEGIRK